MTILDYLTLRFYRVFYCTRYQHLRKSDVEYCLNCGKHLS